MNIRTRFVGLAAGCGLLLAAFVLLDVRSIQAVQITPVGNQSSLGDTILYPTAEIITITTVLISNEPPGYLIDHLYDTLGDVSFFDALGYLKNHSNGVISEEFYQAVDNALFDDSKRTMLIDYRRPFTGSLEIGDNGTANLRSLHGNAVYSGFTTAPGSDGQFILTYTLDPAYYIHTGTVDVYGFFIWYYKTFAIAWRGYDIFLPLVEQNPSTR